MFLLGLMMGTAMANDVIVPESDIEGAFHHMDRDGPSRALRCSYEQLLQ